LTEYPPNVGQNPITIKKDIVKNKNNVSDNREDILALLTDRQKPIVAVSVHQQTGIHNSEEKRSDL
jgi:hypothetical protein